MISPSNQLSTSVCVVLCLYVHCTMCVYICRDFLHFTPLFLMHNAKKGHLYGLNASEVHSVRFESRNRFVTFRLRYRKRANGDEEAVGACFE